MVAIKTLQAKDEKPQEKMPNGEIATCQNKQDKAPFRQDLAGQNIKEEEIHSTNYSVKMSIG